MNLRFSFGIAAALFGVFQGAPSLASEQQRSDSPNFKTRAFLRLLGRLPMTTEITAEKKADSKWEAYITTPGSSAHHLPPFRQLGEGTTPRSAVRNALNSAETSYAAVLDKVGLTGNYASHFEHPYEQDNAILEEKLVERFSDRGNYKAEKVELIYSTGKRWKVFQTRTANDEQKTTYHSEGIYISKAIIENMPQEIAAKPVAPGAAPGETEAKLAAPKVSPAEPKSELQPREGKNFLARITGLINMLNLPAMDTGEVSRKIVDMIPVDIVNYLDDIEISAQPVGTGEIKLETTMSANGRPYASSTRVHLNENISDQILRHYKAVTSFWTEDIHKHITRQSEPRDRPRAQVGR